jgi:Superfamily II helicase and inactivated derivatives
MDTFSNFDSPENPTTPTNEFFPDVDIFKNAFGKWKSNGNSQPYFIPYGRAVWVLEVFVEIESGNEWLKLKFVTNTTTNSTKVVEIPRSLLNAQGASRLCELGIDAQPHNAMVLFQLIQKQEMSMQKTFRHNYIGWALDQNKQLLFKGVKTIGDISSTYVGGKDFGTSGKYKSWKEMVCNEVIGQAPLEFAIILGLSSTLVGYINQFEPTESLLVHLCGDSSTGKTTAARLAVSVAGKPSFAGNTLMGTFLSTKNAITKNISNNYGFPQVFDELSMFSGNLTDLIYTLASGREKARLNNPNSMKDSENWATTIITTGEKSLLAEAKQNVGLSVRAFVFDNVKWTKDADQAERISSALSKNYGFATLEFAKCLLYYDIEKLNKKLSYWRNEYIKETSVHDQFTERVSKKYSIILVTARIANEALGLNFKAKRILNFILENEANSDVERDIGLKAYELFLEFVETNHSNFGLKLGGKWDDVRGNQNFGVVEILASPEELKGVIYNKYIIISFSKFNMFCSQKGFEEPKIVLKNWKQKGLLKSERDRLVSDKKISSTGNAVKCYIIRISSERTAQDSYKAEYTRTHGKTGEDDFSL